MNGKRGVWGHAIGGMGAITQAMALCCAARGVDIRKNCAVSESLIEKGRAASVVTDKGEKLAACALVSGLHPKLTFERLILLIQPYCPPISALASPPIAAARDPSA